MSTPTGGAEPNTTGDVTPPARPPAAGCLGPLLLAALIIAAAAFYRALPGAVSLPALPAVDPADLLVLVPAVAALALLLLVLFYRAGQLIAAVWLGFRVQRFAAGPLLLERRAGALRAGVNRKLSLWSGFISAVPAREGNATRRLALLALGGPLGALALALLSALLLFVVPLGEQSILCNLVLWATLVLGLVVFVLAALPVRPRGILGNGAQIRLLLRGGPEADRIAGLALLSSLTVSGQRPRDWSPQLIADVTALSDETPETLAGALLAYTHYLDAGNVDEARRHLQRGRGVRLAAPGRMGFWDEWAALEEAYMAARFDGNVALGRAIIDRLAEGIHVLLDRYPGLRVQAAVLLAEGKRDEAIKKAQQGLLSVRRATDRGGAEAEEDWLRQILAEAEGKKEE